MDPLALIASSLIAKAPPPTLRAYALEVKTICIDARMFDGTHAIGTRNGAIAVARDIRLTGQRRLNQVDALPRPGAIHRRISAWLALERQLVALYATTYVRIWNAIERAHTTHERVRLPRLLRSLVDEPRPLEQRAAELEVELGLPDCTGAGQSTQPINP